jgi:predicted negative regulator of RcsB-dependent stress response
LTEPKLTKEELREDPVLDAVMRAGQFFREKAMVLIIALVVMAAGLVVLRLVRGGRERAERQAAVVLMAGENQYNQGGTAEALNQFRQAADRWGGTPSGRIAMLRAADLQLELGNLDEARRGYERFLDGAAEGILRASGLRGLASTLDSMGQKEEAARRFTEASEIESNPLRADDLLSAGNALLDAGKGTEARAAYEKLIATFPEHPRVREAREMIEMAKVRPGGS